jgi:hypothetical protein
MIPRPAASKRNLQSKAMLRARRAPNRANFVGPQCSATSNRASIAACHSRGIVFGFGQFGDVERGIAEGEQRLSLGQSEWFVELSDPDRATQRWRLDIDLFNLADVTFLARDQSASIRRRVPTNLRLYKLFRRQIDYYVV